MSSKFERIQTVEDAGFQHFNKTVAPDFYQGMSYGQKCMELEEQFQTHRQNEDYNWRKYAMDLCYTYEHLLSYFFTRLTGKESKRLTRNEKEINLVISHMLEDPDFKQNLNQKGKQYSDNYFRWANNIREIRNKAAHPNNQYFDAGTAEELLDYLRRIVSVTCDILVTLDPVPVLEDSISVSLKKINSGANRYLEVQIKGNRTAQGDLLFHWQHSGQGQELPRKRRISLPKYADGQEYRCIVTSKRIAGQVECSFQDEKAVLKGSVSLTMNDKDQIRTLTANADASVDGKTISHSELAFQWLNAANGELLEEVEKTITLPERADGTEYRCIITYEPASGSIENTFHDKIPVLTGSVTLKLHDKKTKSSIRMLEAVVKNCETPDSELLYQWVNAKTGKVITPASNQKIYKLPGHASKKEYQCVVTGKWTSGKLRSNTFQDVPPPKPRFPGSEMMGSEILFAVFMLILGATVLGAAILGAGVLNMIFPKNDANTIYIEGNEYAESDNLEHFEDATNKDTEEADIEKEILSKDASTLFESGIDYAESDNFDLAIKYFEAAANSGSEGACMELGDFYSSYNLVETKYYLIDTQILPISIHLDDLDNHGYIKYSYQHKNEEEALKWYQKAADMGNAQGQFRIAEILLQSEPRDDTLIWDYLERAGNQWHPGALVKMAEVYESKEDYANAYNCYMRATAKDPEHPERVDMTLEDGNYIKVLDPKYQYHRSYAYEALGQFYETGTGDVEQNITQAVAYYREALKLNPYSDVQDRLDALLPQLYQQAQPE